MRENKMNTKPLFLGVALALTTPVLTTPTYADILSIAPHAQVLTNANLPKRGETMRSVVNKFGKAQRVKKSKGLVTKKNPRITQWDYSGFSVYFENTHVIHSVIHR